MRVHRAGVVQYAVGGEVENPVAAGFGFEAVFARLGPRIDSAVSRPVKLPQRPDLTLGQCSAGRFYGALKGEFVASATSFTPSGDTATTGVISFTADLVLRTKDGDVFLKDAGTFNTTPGGRGEHATVTTVTGGSGAYAGASGRLLETGTFTPADGGYSDYTGEICTP